MRQLILAAVPPERTPVLRRADGRLEFVPARRWADAFDTIRLQRIEMAVVDPTLGGEPRSHEIERLRLLFPSLPVLIYTTLEPRTAGVLLQLGRVGITRAIFHPFDDSPRLLRHALTAALEQSASQRVVASMAPVLQQLPPQLHTALETVLGTGFGSCTVSDLADLARLERRTVERLFGRAGLPSPRIVLQVLRVLYAHRLLLDPGHTVEDVALKLGYGKAKTLQAHCRETFGLTAGEMRISLSLDEATAAVQHRYFPHALARTDEDEGAMRRSAAS